MAEPFKSRLMELSDELADVVSRAAVAVVQLHSRHRLPSSAVVWSNDGLLVTADHVVEFDDGLSVGLADGRQWPATLVGRDPNNDIALLRVETGELAPAETVEEGVRVGSLALALGRPYSNGVTASVGIVSQRTGPYRSWRGGLVDGLLVSDVAMYPGFSGGALVDGAGRILGVNTSIMVRGFAAAIPSKTVRRVVEALRADGRMRRGYLGVSAHPVPLGAALQRGQSIRQAHGLLVVGVEPGSPADEAGLVLGDVILTFEGTPVEHGDELQLMLRPETIGAKVNLGLLRGGEARDTIVTVGERP